MANFLQDTEAVPILKLSGIPIKGPVFRVTKVRCRDRQTESERKERKQKGTETEGRAKPHQKGKKRYTKFKNSFMKTRSRKEWHRGREGRVENGLMALHENNKEFKKKKESLPQRSRLHVQIFNCWSKQLHLLKRTNTSMHACRAWHTQSRVILRDNVFSSIEASLGWIALVLWLGSSEPTSYDSS